MVLQLLHGVQVARVSATPALEVVSLGLSLPLRGTAHPGFFLLPLGLASSGSFLFLRSVSWLDLSMLISGVTELDLPTSLQGVGCLDVSLLAPGAVSTGSVLLPRGLATLGFFLLALELVHPSFLPSLRAFSCFEPPMSVLGGAYVDAPLFGTWNWDTFGSCLSLRGMSWADPSLSVAGAVHLGSSPSLHGVA